MSAPLLGVVELNLLFLGTGLALLAGLHGWETWLEVLDTLGLALVLGACTVGLLATLVLIAGYGLPMGTILALAGLVAAAGIALAAWLRRPLPHRIGALPRLSRGSVVATVEAVATCAVLVELFRLARVMPMGGGDSFEFWVPKAKIIYFFGTIGSHGFTALAGPRYPLYVPALQAMDFRFMGSAYAPELAVQYWFLYVGFVFAAAFLLRRLVPAWLAWLFVGLTAAIPQLDQRLMNSQADWVLDLVYALAALAALVWSKERGRWLLVVLGILLAAEIATKQEGLLLTGCLLAGLAAASFRDARRTWPPLAATFAGAYLVNLPWRIWWGERHLPAALPTIGPADLVHHLHRGWASLHLVLRLLLDYGMWLALLPIATVAAVASVTLAGRARETAVTYLVTSFLGAAGFTYVLWSDLTYRLDRQQSSTPIPRAVGSLVLFAAVLAPALIAPLLERAETIRGPASRAPEPLRPTTSS